MNRRDFLYLAAAAASNEPLAGLAAAAPAGEARGTSLNVHPFIRSLLATQPTGFPTVTPLFAAAFVPGSGAPKMVRAETFADFNAQVDTLASSGYRLACFTTIQSMNRTWFYGAFVPGAGTYLLLRTTDGSAFQQTFQQRQGKSTLVDFNIAWELGQIYYSGYWLDSSTPKTQTLVWNQTFQGLGAQWNTLSSSGGMRMSRVQALPSQDSSAWCAIFEQGSGAYVLYVEPIGNFSADVTGQFAGESLVGLGYDPVSGNLAGCWRGKVTPSQYSDEQDWDTLTATVQQAAAKGMVPQAITAYPNAPSFADYFETNLAPFSMGYGYAVARDGVIIADGVGYARSPLEKTNPGALFTGDTRINLASVSKSVTGIALEVLLQQYTSITLDSPFWPLIQSKVPNPDPSVKTVTLRNLATMKSGMTQEVNEGPLNPPAGSDLWGFIGSYLAHPLVATPGVTYYYDNTNFTILQGVIEQVSGMAYTDFVAKYVFTPAGIDTSVFSATPDPSASASLLYSGPADPLQGQYFSLLSFVAPGGWISSARQLVKLLAALRGESVLPQAAVSEMFNDGIGWYTNKGNFGNYYQHNGSIGNGLTPSQRMNSCVFHFAEGYDVALISNCVPPVDVTTICQGAFDSRGLPASAFPVSGPAVTTIVHATSFLPAMSPGCYGAVIGSGLSAESTDWTATIGNGQALPIEVGGIRVRVGSQFAYIAYVSPTQINFLLPSSTPAGLLNVEVTTPSGGVTTSVQVVPLAPGLSAYQLHGVSYPAALIAGSATLVAATGAIPGYTSRPAAAGDIIELYGTGMGSTNPAAPDGQVFSGAYPATQQNAFQATIGGVNAAVKFAGLIGPGLFQIDLQVPSGVGSGDQPIALSVNGAGVQPNLMLTIR